MASSRRALSVLFIEDSPSDACILAAALHDSDVPTSFDVRVETTLAAGLAALMQSRFDLVLLDLNLPDSSGIATFEAVRVRNPGTPLVILTSNGSEELALAAVLDGAQDFIHKDHVDPYWMGRAVTHAVARAELQARASAAEMELQRAKRVALDDRAALLAKLSHEIRAPLSVIVMASELAHDDSDRESHAGLLSSISENGRHLNDLIGDFLDQTSVESGQQTVKLGPVPLAATIAAGAQLLRPAFARQGVSLSVRIAPDLPGEIDSDALRLRQIITNLLSNALKFTPRGGSVTVEARRSLDGGSLEVEVQDTGSGIPEARRGDLFKPFAQLADQVSDAPRGTGLGLTLSRDLARLLGGDLELARTEEGVGSSFLLRVALRRSRRGRLKGANVLLVDDMADSRTLCRAVLESEGARVVEAATAEKGLSLAATDEFTAYVLDLELPDLPGTELARRLNGAARTRTLVALSAHDAASIRADCLASGFTAALSKPVDREALVAALRAQ